MSFFKKLAKKVGGTVKNAAVGATKGVRGLGRIVRGDFDKGFSDLGSFAKDTALPVGAAMLGAPALAKLAGSAGGLGGLAAKAGGGLKGAGGLLKGGASLAGKGLDLAGQGGGKFAGLSNILKGGGAVLGGKMAYDSYKQAGKDSKKARELADRAATQAQGGADFAMEQFMANQGMRDLYRRGTENFRDPTNPFARA